MNLRRPVGWRYDSHRHYLAAKGIKTKMDMNGALRRTNEYIEENTRKHVKSPTFMEFTRDVVKSARHPMQDADEQWKSDQLAAGRTPTLSSDPVERNQERGAAIIGNVVTFANVEPLIDKNEHKRPAKTQLFDFMLGRRMIEEKYMAKKGEYFAEKSSEEIQEGAEYRRIRLSKPHIVIADTSVGTIIEDQNGRGLVTSGGSHSLPVDQDTDVAISKVKKSIEELDSQDWTEGTREKLKNVYGLKLQALKELREQEERK